MIAPVGAVTDLPSVIAEAQRLCRHAGGAALGIRVSDYEVQPYLCCGVFRPRTLRPGRCAPRMPLHAAARLQGQESDEQLARMVVEAAAGTLVPCFLEPLRLASPTGHAEGEAS